jgi:hypothetical protein
MVGTYCEIIFSHCKDPAGAVATALKTIRKSDPAQRASRTRSALLAVGAMLSWGLDSVTANVVSTVCACAYGW